MPTLQAYRPPAARQPIPGWDAPAACDTPHACDNTQLDPSEGTHPAAPDPEQGRSIARPDPAATQAIGACAEELGHRSPNPDPDTLLAAHPLELQSRFQNLLHERVKDRRAFLIDALWEDAADLQLRKRARQMGWCCSTPSLRLASHGPTPSLARCRDRLCPLCARLRGVQAAGRTAAIVRTFNSPRFVTLTLAHQDTPLADQIDRLHDCVRKLRGSKLWRKCVSGGILATEVTFRTAADRWHPHAHLITTGRYIPWAVLKAEWKRVTGDSDIVQIKMIHDREKAAGYIARYVGKPVDAESWPPARVREYAHAMKGRRLLQPFGCAMKCEVDDDADDSTAPGTEHLVDAARLVDAAASGLPQAITAVEILARTGAAMAAILLRPRAPGDQPTPPTAAEIAYAVAVARVTHSEPANSLQHGYDALPPPPVAGESTWPTETAAAPDS